jgi:hypothetical protein
MRLFRQESQVLEPDALPPVLLEALGQLDQNALVLAPGEVIVFASENIQYDGIIPFYDITTPTSATSLSAKIRSVSGTSISGNEISFQDFGYEDIQINSLNTLSSSRIVASKVNEDTFLTALPRNKSFTKHNLNNILGNIFI